MTHPCSLVGEGPSGGLVDSVLLQCLVLAPSLLLGGCSLVLTLGVRSSITPVWAVAMTSLHLSLSYLVFCDHSEGQRNFAASCAGSHIWTPGIHTPHQPVS